MEDKKLNKIKERVRTYILDEYEERGYKHALSIANSYMQDSNKTQRKFKVKDFATTVRGELSEIFLEVCVREFVKTHKNTFYIKGLCIPRTDGKEGYTELDLTLFTPNKVFLFECKSYSGKKRLIEEGVMVTDRFAPYNVFKQNRMHLDNFRRYIDKARLKDLTEGKPYSISMFSFNTEDITDMRTVEWQKKFPLNTERTILDWISSNCNSSKEIWDIKLLYKIVSKLDESSESNFKKHLAISRKRNKGGH